MKGTMMQSAQDICGMTKGMKTKYEKWKKENMNEARMEYRKSRQNAKRVISSAKVKN